MSGSPGWTLFDTALGPMGVAWGEQGLRALQLPDPDADRIRSRLRRHASGSAPASPPAEVQAAIDGIRALLRGGPADLAAIRLDMRRIPPFERRVYEAARGIPPGSVLSYGELAERLGDRQLARAVGQALARNPFAPVVPCHRVLAAGGRAGGFSAPGGLRTKWQLLQIERARLGAEPGLFDPD